MESGIAPSVWLAGVTMGQVLAILCCMPADCAQCIAKGLESLAECAEIIGKVVSFQLLECHASLTEGIDRFLDCSVELIVWRAAAGLRHRASIRDFSYGCVERRWSPSDAPYGPITSRRVMQARLTW